MLDLLLYCVYVGSFLFVLTIIGYVLEKLDQHTGFANKLMDKLL